VVIVEMREGSDAGGGAGGGAAMDAPATGGFTRTPFDFCGRTTGARFAAARFFAAAVPAGLDFGKARTASFGPF